MFPFIKSMLVIELELRYRFSRVPFPFRHDASTIRLFPSMTVVRRRSLRGEMSMIRLFVRTRVSRFTNPLNDEMSVKSAVEMSKCCNVIIPLNGVMSPIGFPFNHSSLTSVLCRGDRSRM